CAIQSDLPARGFLLRSHPPRPPVAAKRTVHRRIGLVSHSLRLQHAPAPRQSAEDLLRTGIGTIAVVGLSAQCAMVAGSAESSCDCSDSCQHLHPLYAALTRSLLP